MYMVMSIVFCGWLTDVVEKLADIPQSPWMEHLFSWTLWGICFILEAGIRLACTLNSRWLVGVCVHNLPALESIQPSFRLLSSSVKSFILGLDEQLLHRINCVEFSIVPFLECTDLYIGYTEYVSAMPPLNQLHQVLTEILVRFPDSKFWPVFPWPRFSHLPYQVTSTTKAATEYSETRVYI